MLPEEIPFLSVAELSGYIKKKKLHRLKPSEHISNELKESTLN